MYMDEHYDAARPDSYYAPESYEQGYLSDEHKISMASPSHFLGTYDDTSILKSGLYKGAEVDSGHVYQSNAAKSIDPRLMMLLEYSKQLYIRKRELLKKIFPEIQDEFAELFSSIGAVLSQGKTQQREVKTIRRSLSLGSQRTRGIGGVEPRLRLRRFLICPVDAGGRDGGVGEPRLRLEWFKIRTVVADGGDGGVGGGSGQGGQGTTKGGNSK